MSLNEDGVRASVMNKYRSKQADFVDTWSSEPISVEKEQQNNAQKGSTSPTETKVISSSLVPHDEAGKPETNQSNVTNGYDLGSLGVLSVMGIELFEWHSKAAVTPVNVLASDKIAASSATPMMAAIVESKSTPNRFLVVVFYVDVEGNRHTYCKIVITDDFTLSLVPQGSLVLPGSSSKCIVMIPEAINNHETKQPKVWALAFPAEDSLADFVRTVVFCKAKAASVAHEAAVIKYVEEGHGEVEAEEEERGAVKGTRTKKKKSTVSGTASQTTPSQNSPPSPPEPILQDVLVGSCDANVVTVGDIVRIRYSVYLPSAAHPRGGYGAMLYEASHKALYVGGGGEGVSSDYPRSRDTLHPAIERALHGMRRRSLRLVVIPHNSHLASIPSDWGGVYATNSDIFIEIACTQHKAVSAGDANEVLMIQRPLAVASGPKRAIVHVSSSPALSPANSSSVLSSTPTPETITTTPDRDRTSRRYGYASQSLVESRYAMIRGGEEVDADADADSKSKAKASPIATTHDAATAGARDNNEMGNFDSSSSSIASLTNSHAHASPNESVLDRIKRVSKAQSVLGGAASQQLALPPPSPGLRPLTSSSSNTTMLKQQANTPTHAIVDTFNLSSSGGVGNGTEKPPSSSSSTSPYPHEESFVTKQLRELGVDSQIIDRFMDERITTANDVLLLSEADLKELLPALGLRRRFIYAAQSNSASPSSSISSSSPNTAATTSPSPSPSPSPVASAVAPQQPAQTNHADALRRFENDSRYASSPSPSASSLQRHDRSTSNMGIGGVSVGAGGRDVSPPSPQPSLPQPQPISAKAASNAVASLLEEAYERGRSESIQLAKDKIDALKRTATTKFEELKEDTNRTTAAAEARAYDAEQRAMEAERRAQAAERQINELRLALDQAIQEQTRLKEITRTYVGKSREERKDEQKKVVMHALESAYSRVQKSIQPNDVFDGLQALQVVRDQLKEVGTEILKQMS